MRFLILEQVINVSSNYKRDDHCYTIKGLQFQNEQSMDDCIDLMQPSIF